MSLTGEEISWTISGKLVTTIFSIGVSSGKFEECAENNN
jgi:hypothetical protein